jgi:hypothetical protein
LVPPVNASQVGLTWNERWHLDLFRKFTVHQCSEYFEDTFWCSFIHQVLETQPAARYAAIAFSARHWQYDQVETNQIADRESILALQHSCKAVSCLRKSLINDTPDRAHRETVLVTCLILTMLALFQEDDYAARCHFLSGYKLFQYWEAVDYDESPNGRALKQAFVQLHLHYMTSSNPRLFVDNQRLVSPQITDIYTNMPLSGDVVARAQRFVRVIARVAMQCLPHGGFCIGPAGWALGRGATALLCVLRMWRSQLTAFSMQGEVLSEFDHDILTLLELWSVVIDIRLAVCDSSEPLEVTYDDYVEQFRSVIQMAKSLLQANLVVLPEGIIKTSLVPALLWCGMKCRDPLIRDDILWLIDGVKGQDTGISAVLLALQRVIEYESEHVKLGTTIPETARVDSVQLNIQPGQDQLDLWYRRSRLDPHLHDDHDMWEHHIIYI